MCFLRLTIDFSVTFDRQVSNKFYNLARNEQMVMNCELQRMQRCSDTLDIQLLYLPQDTEEVH